MNDAKGMKDYRPLTRKDRWEWRCVAETVLAGASATKVLYHDEATCADLEAEITKLLTVCRTFSDAHEEQSDDEFLLPPAVVDQQDWADFEGEVEIIREAQNERRGA